MKIASASVGLALFMVLLSLKEAHGLPGIEAIYGVVGATFYALMTKILSLLIQREGLSDD